jgi:hypothetical protein
MCVPLVLSVKLSRVETKCKSEAKPYVHASIRPPSKRIKHEDDSDSNGPGIPSLPAKAPHSSTPEYVPPSKSMVNVGQSRKPVKKYLGSGSRTKPAAHDLGQGAGPPESSVSSSRTGKLNGESVGVSSSHSHAQTAHAELLSKPISSTAKEGPTRSVLDNGRDKPVHASAGVKSNVSTCATITNCHDRNLTLDPPTKSKPQSQSQSESRDRGTASSGRGSGIGSTPKLAHTSTALPVASVSRTTSVSTYINSSPSADISAIGTSSRTTSTTRSGELHPLPRTKESPSSEFHQPPPQMQVHSGLSSASASAEGTSDGLKQHLISRNIPLDAFIRFAALLRSSGSEGFDQRLWESCWRGQWRRLRRLGD